MNAVQNNQAASHGIRPRAALPGFSLLEVMLAVMILGIGLILVASLFPMGARWTQQNAEESVGMMVGRNAAAIVQLKYRASDLASVGFGIVALPGIGSAKLPLVERAYAFGASPPYPASDPARASYYWTALVRRTPADDSRHHFDLFIFVFRKGQAEQTFTQTPPGGRLIDGVRGAGETGVPTLAVGNSAQALDAGYTAFSLLSQGVGAQSGTVFKKLATGPRPALSANDADVVFAVPADGTEGSPLVGVYQTSLLF